MFKKSFNSPFWMEIIQTVVFCGLTVSFAGRSASLPLLQPVCHVHGWSRRLLRQTATLWGSLERVEKTGTGLRDGSISASPLGLCEKCF